MVHDVEPAFGGPVDGHRVTSVSVEVAGQGQIAWVSEEEGDVGHSLGVRVPQIDVSVRPSIQPWSVDPVTVPVPHKPKITRIPKVEIGGRCGGSQVSPLPGGGIVEDGPVSAGNERDDADDVDHVVGAET